MPRARIQQADGMRTEWRSETVRRYERRTARVDEAILGVYLAGGNTRRIKGALAPLLQGGPLSKDAVSRLVGRLREDFETWRNTRTVPNAACLSRMEASTYRNRLM
jgi:transposase-like protein